MPAIDPKLFESHQDIIPLEVIKDRHITIIGCGSIGTITARILARLGTHRFHLVDGDKVEMRHLNREVFALDQIGTNKATALAYQLTGIHPRVRAVTTAKKFDPSHLERGKEDIILLTTNDPGIPQAVLDAVNTWDDAERPALFCARHSRLLGGYWFADLRRNPTSQVPGLSWLRPTGVETEDARARIATTAHVVSGLVAQAIAEHMLGHQVADRIDIDLARLIKPGADTGITTTAEAAANT